MVQHLQPGDEVAVYPVEVFLVGVVEVGGDPRIAIGLTTEEAQQFIVALDTEAARQLTGLLRRELSQQEEL
jgi:hypothetical protein